MFARSSDDVLNKLGVEEDAVEVLSKFFVVRAIHLRKVELLCCGRTPPWKLDHTSSSLELSAPVSKHLSLGMQGLYLQ